jgi:hypothetical protein
MKVASARPIWRKARDGVVFVSPSTGAVRAPCNEDMLP